MEDNILKQNLLKAIKKTKNTVQKKISFTNIPNIINDLSKKLKNDQYKPSKFSCFAVKDPKIREIFAPDYKDRVIHHFVLNYINCIDKKFIDDCYSNRKNKGIHKGVKRLQKFMHKKNQYYLMADIKTFFPSINKEILYNLILNHVKSIEELSCEEKNIVLNLLEKIVFQDPIKPLPVFKGNRKNLSLVPKEKSLFYSSKDVGLPIGSLTSQFFANIYLNELDQFIKHKLKIKYYIRYVDDFIILANDTKTLLMIKDRVQNFLYEKLKLTLHPKKIVIQHKSKGINFLGYIVKENYILIRKRTVKSFKRKLYFFNHLLDPINFPIKDIPVTLNLGKKYQRKEITPPIDPDLAFLQKVLAVLNSYYGIFSFASTYNLRKTLYQKHFHHLKKYFLPKNNYKILKINSAFIKKRKS